MITQTERLKLTAEITENLKHINTSDRPYIKFNISEMSYEVNYNIDIAFGYKDPFNCSFNILKLREIPVKEATGDHIIDRSKHCIKETNCLSAKAFQDSFLKDGSPLLRFFLSNISRIFFERYNLDYDELINLDMSCSIPLYNGEEKVEIVAQFRKIFSDTIYSCEGLKWLSEFTNE